MRAAAYTLPCKPLTHALRGGSHVEITIGQVCACLPFTNFLLQRKAQDGVVRRQTKRTRPTAHVWFRSLRTQEHTLSSLSSSFTRSFPPRPPPSAGPVLGGSAKGGNLGSSRVPPVPRRARLLALRVSGSLMQSWKQMAHSPARAAWRGPRRSTPAQSRARRFGRPWTSGTIETWRKAGAGRGRPSRHRRPAEPVGPRRPVTC